MEYSTFEAAYPSSMGELDAFMMDAANRSARDQIARQLAASQAYRRQQQSRICKPSSTGNSPQNLAWRRQVAGSRGFFQPMEAHNAVRRRAATSTSGRPLTSHADSRPVSWHPHSVGMASYDQNAVRHSMYEADRVQQQQQQQQQQLHQQRLSAYSTVAMHGLPTPLALAQTGDMPLDGCFSLDSSPAIQREYVHVPVSSEWATDTPEMVHMAHPSGSHATAYPMDFTHSSFDFYQQMMDTSRSSPATLAHSTMQTTLATPDAFSTQKPETVAVVSCHESVNAVDENGEDDGPELVGMGLYDSTPGGSSFGLFGSGNRGSNTLKLCDPWTPPEEDANDDDDDNDEEEEGDDDDEGSEEEDEGEGEQESDDQDYESEPEPSEECVELQSRTQLPGSDLSNKTFFFDETEMTVTGWGMTRTSWSQ